MGCPGVGDPGGMLAGNIEDNSRHVSDWPARILASRPEICEIWTPDSRDLQEGSLLPVGHLGHPGGQHYTRMRGKLPGQPPVLTFLAG